MLLLTASIKLTANGYQPTAGYAIVQVSKAALLMPISKLLKIWATAAACLSVLVISFLPSRVSADCGFAACTSDDLKSAKYTYPDETHISALFPNGRSVTFTDNTPPPNDYHFYKATSGFCETATVLINKDDFKPASGTMKGHATIPLLVGDGSCRSFSSADVTIIKSTDPATDAATDKDPCAGKVGSDLANCQECNVPKPTNETIQHCLSGNSIVKDLNTIVNFLAGLVAIVVIGVIIFGGIQYISAGDNATQITAAKQRVMNGIIALLIFIFTYAFLQWLIPGGVFK